MQARLPLPIDLSVVVTVALGAIIITLFPGSWATGPQIVFGMVLLVMLPGYAFIAALFPASPPDTNVTRHQSRRSPTLPVRLALAIGTSLVISPLVLLLLATPFFGLHHVSIVVTLAGLTIAWSALAAIRRAGLPPQRRFTLELRDWVEQVWTTQPRQWLLIVVIVSSLLITTGGVVYIAATAPISEPSTAFFIESEDDYPTNMVTGEIQSVDIGIENNEHEPTTYTVVIQREQVDVEADSRKREELDRYQVTLEHGEHEVRTHTIEAGIDERDIRITYLLYIDEPPANPSSDNAYRETYLQISITESDDEPATMIEGGSV